jgi:parallel beta-helix repeat protein
MAKKALFLVFTFLLIIASLSALPWDVKAQSIQTIVIQQDGSISPSSVPIKQEGNTYTFTDNIFATIRVMKSNIVINGAGYTLQGPYNGTHTSVWVIGEGPDQLPEGVLEEYTIGVDLGDKSITGLTVTNLNIKNFSIGIYLYTKNNTLIGNSVCENVVGVLISGSNNTVTDNYIAKNTQGLFFGFNDPSDIPQDVIISHNGFDQNKMQINGCLCDEYPENEPPHAWDNGKTGNYWSDYGGSDADGDGIGDTPYVVDIQNQDRYPLMQNPTSILNPEEIKQSALVPIELLLLAVVAPVVIIITVLVVSEIRNRKKSSKKSSSLVQLVGFECTGLDVLGY